MKQVTAEVETLLLGKVTKVNGNCDMWVTKILVGSQETIDFEVYSGSGLMAIRSTNYHKSYMVS